MKIISDQLQIYARRDSESFIDYWIRLFENMNTYGLTCQEIADLLNTERGTTYSESKWRKDYKQFTRGRQYERQKQESDLLEERTQELVKARMLLSDERAAIKSSLRTEARNERFVGLIRQQFSETTPITLPIKRLEKLCHQGNGHLLVCFNDGHIGMRFRQAGRCYDISIAADRVAQYVEYVKDACKVYKPRVIDVALLGDQISGLIHQTLRIENQENVIEQVKTVSELLAQFITGVSTYAERIVIHAVGGNHSRLMSKDDSLIGELLDNLIPWYLQARLSQIENIYFPDDENMFPLMSTQWIQSRLFIYVHGDCDTLDEKNIARIASITGGVMPHAIIAGHLHEVEYKDVMGVHILRSGCLSGSGDEYTSKNRLSCKPSQLMAYTDEGGEIRALLPVYFD